ncbi:hypothetical protein OGH69_17190 [Flavobacterium sp. MFBS3-15]|uniref:hypothetical protein n=1 Tax=Flavobacterium sp. MFBS3-15 TaxID=2989816 RepID=UPI0022367F12|nr:hypothetical protein [Flavobacterium sp. MFBS3-15]MCW4470710.1 hypothetical protein [Flavobacterium sp. MFBS3-15]
MLYKYLPLLGIIFLLTLLLSVKQSRKNLWRQDTSRNSRMYTFRAVFVIVVLIVFLFFSMVR